MHHQMGVGDGFVDFSDAADRQHFTCGLAGEFIRTMACADGDGQGINLCFGDKISSFCWVGEELIFGELTLKSMAVFGFTFTGF